jgi:tetratricopeptide (TPR) repeat protein
VTRVQEVRAGSRRLVCVVAAALIAFVASCGSGQTDQQQAAAILQEGLAAHSSGDLAKAEADYRRVLVLDPSNKFAYYNLGLIAQSQGDPLAADRNYRIVLGIDPEFAPALYNLAIIRTDAGAKDEAIDLYRRAIQSNPTDAAAHLNLGLLLIGEGQQAAGQSELDLAVQLDPDLASRIPSPPATGGTPLPPGQPGASPSVSPSP